MAEVEIRSLTPEDVQATVTVWERSRRRAQPWLEERLNYSRDQNLEYFRNVIAREYAVWVAWSGRRIVGLLALGSGKIDQLFVDPDHQRKGVGSTLLRKAKALEPGGLTLFTHQRNTSARSFYERHGFRSVRFGVSPPPESEPDVLYVWDAASETPGS